MGAVSTDRSASLCVKSTNYVKLSLLEPLDSMLDI